MSDRPRENVLDEIMSRAPAYSPEPAVPLEPAEDVLAKSAAEPSVPDPAPANEKRSKPSSVYLYLVILFGAAFLMLLLAYFVQRRNSAAVQDDLRIITASKAELLEEIEALKEEKQSLLEEMDNLRLQLQQAQSALNAANADVDFLKAGYEKYVGYSSILDALYASEVKLGSGDYDGAAEELTGIEYNYFIAAIDLHDAENPGNPDAMLLRPRFDELVSVLTERGVLEEGWSGQE